MDFGRSESFILPVVPLHQVGVSLCHGCVAGKFAGPYSALQRTRKNLGECQILQPFAKALRVELAVWRKRQIGKAGVLPRDTPRRVTVAGQIHDRQRITHAISLLCRRRGDYATASVPALRIVWGERKRPHRNPFFLCNANNGSESMRRLTE